MKKLFATAFLLIAFSVSAAYAAPAKPEAPPPPPAPSGYNPADYEATPPGQVSLVIGPAIGWGFGVDAGADFMIGKFAIPKFPIDWGISIRGLAVFGFWGGFEWSASALWTMHKGFSFARGANFDIYFGVGIGFGGYAAAYWGAPFGVGFSTYDGVAWEFTKNWWLQLEYGGVYGWNVSTSIFSIGLRINL